MLQRYCAVPTLRLVALFFSLILTSTLACGQAASQFDRGTPPQHAAGVASFGSYTSPDLGTVNLSNGSLNLAIPLGTVGGRGFSIPITLNYSSKVWSVSKETDWVNGSTTVPYASYGVGDFLAAFQNRLSPGWTVGIAPWMSVRSFGLDPLVHPGCGYNRYLTKLTVMLPDRGEIELRDDYTDGAPHLATTKPNTGNCRWYDAYRGRRWHAVDGSGIIFISDVDNAVVNGDLAGVLITADGKRYRFEHIGATGLNVFLGRATSVTDRNGNKITITYPTNDEVNYTDQLNRATKIKKNVQDPQTGQQLAVLVELPGYGGPRFFKVKAGEMSQNYRAGINPSLPVINGAYNPENYFFTEQWWAGGTSLFAESYCLFIERLDTQQVVNELILPDNRSLRFKYNQYGEVAEVQLPTGGKMQYDFEQASALPTGVSLPNEVQTWTIPVNIPDVDRALVARRTYADGVNLESSWTYTYSASTAEIRAFSASGTLLRNEKHYFMPAVRYLEPFNDSTNGTGYFLWSTGLVSRSEIRNAADVVISATESDWTQRSSVSWWTGYTQQQPANDNRVNQTRRHLETGQMARVETFYDQYNNPTEVKEYDYDQTLKRRTVTSYLSTHNGYHYQTDDSIHLLSLPETTTIFNGAGTQVAQGTNEYDVYISDGNHNPLTAYGSVSQHDANYGVSKTTRGNITRIGQWLNTSGTFIYLYPRFDTLGNVVSTKDANGNVTTFSFADDFGLGLNPGTPTQNPTAPTYALPTLITSPPPLSGAPVHTARSQYDYSTGLLTGFRDRNNIVTQTIYNDPFNRPTQVRAALGVTDVESHVSTYYAPATVFGITLAKNDILITSDLNVADDASLRSWTVTDGFGRTTEAWTSDPQGDVKIITEYDCLSRVKQTSDLFRPATESPVYTTTAYDLAGRVTSVTTPDNAVVNTSYNGNSVTVTDQAGKARKRVTDGLGRLLEVYEDPIGWNYQTSYNYDALDNLVKVTQGSQQRFFMYDSLKRLIRARNPEQATDNALALTDPLTQNSQWSTGYAYDANSNLTEKTDARGVISTYEYDALNRNIRTNYSNTLLNPDIKHFYDGATNGKGRFWYFYSGGDFSTGSDVDHTSIDSYDAVGRPLVQRQLFKRNYLWSDTYQISRTYNRAGGVTSQLYPSGNAVAYNHDSAGRLADKDAQNPAFTGNLGGLPRTYSRGISYAASGQLKQEQFGTKSAVYHKLHYNVRRQLCDVRASNVNDEWGGELGALVNYYSATSTHCGSGGDNNDNVLISQTIINSVYFEDRYTYDALNRLTAVSEFQNGSTPTGSQQYSYDRWGNRNVIASSPALGFNTSFEKEDATNRLYAPGDLALADASRRIRYDKAGNQIKDTFTGYGAANFDADNHITAIQDRLGGWSNYTYNADGQRTRRKINNQETWHVYGMDGELLAEYAATAAAATPQTEYGYRNGQLLVIAAVDTVWSDDAVPAGAVVAGDSESWNWVGSNPGSFSGSTAHQSNIGAGLHQHYFYGATATLTVSVGDKLVAYVYLDPGNMPSQIMLQWNDGSWEHRAYWGANNLPWGVDGTNSRRYMGPLPAAGSWVRLEVPASLVGLEGQTLHGMAFSMWGGRATWDRAGKISFTGVGSSLQWLVRDHLGTTRMIIDQTGSLANIKRHDYLPFGEELFVGVGGRTSQLGYSGGAGVRQQFTAKERDNETGLDYFLARYYSSTQGRFTSPDEFTGGPDELYYFVNDASANPTFYADLRNPQSLNKYQYSYNNPLRYIDPDGHDAEEAAENTQEPASAPSFQTPAARVAIKVATESAKGPKRPIPALPLEDPLDPLGSPACCITDYFVEPSPNRIPQQQLAKDETVAPPAPIQASQTEEKKKNLADADRKGIPRDQLGPSGRPKVKVVKHATEKRAKDAARNAGQRQPAKDPRPRKGKPHYHPTNRDGSRKKGGQNIHHEFPG